MKKQLSIVLLALVMVLTVVVGVACEPETPEPTKYTVIYAAGEGSGTAPAAESYEQGASVTLKAASTFTAPEGKEFDGWLVDGEKKAAGATITMPAKDLTITAQWKTKSEPQPEEKWTVTFKNGEETVSTVQVVKGQKLTAEQIPAAPAGIPEDKEFKGWYVGDDKITVDTVIGSDITAIAKIENKPAPQPEEPVITDEANVVILHESELASGAKIEGQLSLFADGTGYINIVNTKSDLAIVEFQPITYSINTEGVLTILTAPDSKITVPATGSIVGHKISITIENGSATGAKTQYKFESDVYSFTLNYGYSIEGVSSQQGYYPAGMQTSLTEIAREGYTLKGFEVNGESKPVSWGESITMPAEDVEITCIWEQIQAVSYTVTYKCGEGQGEDYVETATSASYKLLNKSAADTKFHRDGWALVGWTVNGEEKSFGATITLTGDTEVVARYRQTFTVALAGLNESGVTTSGNLDELTSARYSEVSKFTLPEDHAGMWIMYYVERSGFTLTGWLCSADNQVYAPGAQVPITQNTTFTAQWEQKVVQPANFDGKWSSEQGVVIEAAGITIKDFVIEGSSISGDIQGELAINGNVATITVAGIEYTLTLDGDTLTISAKRLSSTYSGEFVKFVPTDKTLADYEGYWVGEIYINGTTYEVAHIKDGVLNLQEVGYDPEPYELTEDRTGANLVAIYTYDGGSFAGKITITVTFTSDSQFEISYLKNSMFGDDSDNGTFTKSSLYTVTYALGSDYHGTEEAPAAVEVVGGVATQAPTLAKVTGWKFLGWFAEGASEAFDFSQPITANITLTAHWEQITEVTVTFALQAGVTGIEVPAAQTIAFNVAATEPNAEDFARDGYRFDGWYNGKVKWDFASPVTEDITLTAQWSREYTVTYVKPEGATGEVPAAAKVYANDIYTFIDNPFTLEGYEFLGWTVGAATAINKAGTTRKVLNDMKLTAVFAITYANMEDPVDPDLSLVVRSDNKAEFNGDVYDYQIDGIYVALLYSGDPYMYFWTNSATKECKASDWLHLNSFEGTDSSSAAVKLTFDGIGNATIGGKTVAYTIVQDNYGYIVGVTINEQEILFEQVNDVLVINVVIELDGETYTFGNPPVEYTVNFELGGGTGTAPAAIKVMSNVGEITLPNIGADVANGELVFKGWVVKGVESTDPNYEVYAAGAKIEVSADATLVAVWGEVGDEPNPPSDSWDAITTAETDSLRKLCPASTSNGVRLYFEESVTIGGRTFVGVEIIYNGNFTWNGQSGAYRLKVVYINEGAETAAGAITVSNTADWSDEDKSNLNSNLLLFSNSSYRVVFGRKGNDFYVSEFKYSSNNVDKTLRKVAVKSAEEPASLVPYNGTYNGSGVTILGYSVVYVTIEGDNSFTIIDDVDEYNIVAITKIEKVEGLVVATFETGTLTVNADGSITLTSNGVSASYTK